MGLGLARRAEWIQAAAILAPKQSLRQCAFTLFSVKSCALMAGNVPDVIYVEIGQALES
jgi:hypothetical protein